MHISVDVRLYKMHIGRSYKVQLSTATTLFVIENSYQIHYEDLIQTVMRLE